MSLVVVSNKHLVNWTTDIRFSAFSLARRTQAISSYNSPNNFCELSLDKVDHVIQNRTVFIRGYPPSDLISVVWFYFDGRKTKKRANVQAKLLIGQGKRKKKTFCRRQWRHKTLVDNSVLRNTKKSTKYAGTIYVRWLWEIIRRADKINKPLSGLLVYRKIMPLAERLSLKFHSCPRSFASRPTVDFVDNLSALGIILRYTSRRKEFFY